MTLTTKLIWIYLWYISIGSRKPSVSNWYEIWFNSITFPKCWMLTNAMLCYLPYLWLTVHTLTGFSRKYREKNKEKSTCESNCISNRYTFNVKWWCRFITWMDKSKLILYQCTESDEFSIPIHSFYRILLSGIWIHCPLMLSSYSLYKESYWVIVRFQ